MGLLMGKDARTLTVSTAATAVVTVMFAALLVLLVLWLHDSYRSSLLRMEERVTAASKIVATNASWINAVARQALQRIDDSLGPDISVATREVPDINLAVSSLPGQVKAYVVNRDGATLFSTDMDMRPTDITDRPYFLKLAEGAKAYVSGLLVSRLNGEQIFVFSRRLEREGQFVGAAMVSFEGKVLATVWESVDLGLNSTVAIIRRDGELVARYPPPSGPLDMSRYVLFTDYLPKSPSGTYQAVSPADGVSRLVAYRVVDNTDFVVIGSADYAEGMQTFWGNVFIATAVLSFAGVGSFAAGGWIRHLIKKDAAKSARLSAALDENQLLMREIHHRVKNNFQSVQALIRTQQLPEDMQKSLFQRIAAMIAVHEQIYSRDQFATVSARNLIPAVVDTLLAAYGNQVTVAYEIDDIAVSADHATPLALLANEVVTNSLKYAFPDDRKGSLTISLKQLSENRARLVIADDGVGFDATHVRSGMGTRLIRGVMNQLHGEFTHEMKNGTVFSAEIDIIDAHHAHIAPQSG